MIQIRNLTKIFNRNKAKETIALNDISIDLPDKGFVFVVGKSGSGKTTLLSMLGGLNSPTEGEVRVNSLKLNQLKAKELNDYRNYKVGYIFQDYYLIESLTVLENLRLVLDLEHKEDDDLIMATLNRLNIADKINNYPKELSGGEQQRVAIARVIIKSPEIILADEPTGNLDIKTTKLILDILSELSKDSLVVMVSHNSFDAEIYADRIIELKNGTIVSDRLRASNDSAFMIKDDTLYLPLHLKIDDNSKEKLIKDIKTHKIKKISQNNSLFKEEKVILKENIEKSQTKKKQISLKKALSYSLKFSKKSFIPNIIYSLITALLLAILGLSSIFAFYNHFGVIDNFASDYHDPNDSLRIFGATHKNSLTTSHKYNYIYNIPDETYNSIVELTPNNKIYEVYDIFSGLAVSNYSNNSLYFNGVAVCDNDYLINKFGQNGELVFVRKAKEYMPYGYYITDFMAELLARNFRIKPENFIGNVYANKSDYYINGIIKTDFRERHQKIIEEIEKSNQYELKIHVPRHEGFSSFSDEFMVLHNIAYSTNPNFYEAYTKGGLKNYHLGKCILETTDKKHQQSDDFVLNINKTLKDGEIVLAASTINNLLDKNYVVSSNDSVHLLEEAIMLDASFFYPYDKLYDKTVYEIPLKVVGYSLNSYVNQNTLELLASNLKNRTSVIIDGSQNILKLLRLVENNNLLIASNPYSYLALSNSYIDVFADFFKVIFITLVIIAILGLALYNMGVIKAKMEEIGILKALGSSNKNILSFLSINCFAFIVNVLVFFSAFSAFAVKVTNKLLASSIANIDGFTLDLSINYIFTTPLYYLFYSLIIISIVIISLVLPLLRLRKIKPMDIIKAEE